MEELKVGNVYYDEAINEKFVVLHVDYERIVGWSDCGDLGSHLLYYRLGSDALKSAMLYGMLGWIDVEEILGAELDMMRCPQCIGF